MAGQDSDGGGSHRENVYAACSEYVGFLALGESATRSLVRASRGPLSVLLEMLPTHARAHAHTCQLVFVTLCDFWSGLLDFST